MKCEVYRCRRKAVIDVPTGYGRYEKFCRECATRWAEGWLERFKRISAFLRVMKMHPEE